MNHQPAQIDPITFKLTGQLIVTQEQLQQLLKQVMAQINAPRPVAQAVPVPGNAEVFQGRLMLTTMQTAEILGISDKTAYRLVQRKLLRRSNALRHIRIPSSEIERFVRSTVD
jgi:excisionase family DNA binding protein